MEHLLEYDQYEFSDKLKWGDQIKRWIKKSLEGKPLKGGYEIKSVEIVNPSSSPYSASDGGDSGKGTIDLNFKKPNPSDLDQLISDLSNVGLSEDKKIEVQYSIEVNQEDEYYDISVNITPNKIPNFMGIKSDTFSDYEYDMSYGVGKIVSDLISKQIL
jgi:hypothetical protein